MIFVNGHCAFLEYRTQVQFRIVVKLVDASGGVNHAFADKLNLLLVEDGLEKIRATPSQVELNHHQRTMSLRGAIKAKYGFDGAHVLLIDDVATTGSTLMQCAFALNRANAKRVSAIVYAKEMSKDDS